MSAYISPIKRIPIRKKRMFRLRFDFKNKQYDRAKKHYLVAFDEKNDIEVLRHAVVMDIAFANDFGL
jgi:hypothetical protein